METTERVPRDQLNQLVALSKPTGGMSPLPPIVAGSIDEALQHATKRRHPRPESVVAAMLPPIPPPKPKRMRAPTLVGTAPAAPAPVIAKPIVVEAPVVIENPTPSVAIAPAVIAASVRPHRFAIAALLYALVLFALLAAF